MSKKQVTAGPRPIRLYDHVPEILVGQLALFYSLMALLQMACDFQWKMQPLNQHTIFWLSAAGTIAWIISYRWNLSKKNFVLVVALFGFLFGVPAILEIVGVFDAEGTLGSFHPFSTVGNWLGKLAPTASAGAYTFAALVGWGVWLTAFIWSRLHMSATLDESGLTIVRVDGKRERYELIGLKTETDPFDYSELAMLGIGSLTLQTRTGKMIFSMKRVIWLYRIPLLFWITPKVKILEELLSYQGKTTVVNAADRAEIVEAVDDIADDGDEGAVGEEYNDSATSYGDDPAPGEDSRESGIS
jgi:hypothetical protein